MSASPAHLIDHPSEQLVQDLATLVEGQLWQYSPIRQTNTRIEVRADGDGTVYLDGNIRGALLKAMATEIANRVPGVRRVINRLASDTDIEQEIAVQLAMDETLGLTTDHVTLKCIMGVVYLGGMIFADALAEAQAHVDRVEELVRRMPGVREVVSTVRAVEGSPESFAGPADERPRSTPRAAWAPCCPTRPRTRSAP
jgi:osmotically-inducible protein OsmY